MTSSQAAEWRKAARGTAYKLGFRGDDLDDAEVVGWTAAWKAYEKAKSDLSIKDMDGFAKTSLVNAIKNLARDTAKARSEVTNHDWED